MTFPPRCHYVLWQTKCLCTLKRGAVRMGHVKRSVLCASGVLSVCTSAHNPRYPDVECEKRARERLFQAVLKENKQK